MDLPVVNRSAVFLIAKQSFLSWIGRCPYHDLTLTLEDLNDEPTLYLIPTEDAEPDAWLERHYIELFEEELEAWCTDESLWPKDRSHTAFRRFFEVRFSSLVVDTVPGPIKTDEDELEVPRGGIAPLRLVAVTKLSPGGCSGQRKSRNH